MLRLIGADLRLVPAVPYKDPNNYVKFSGRLAERAGRERAERGDLGQPVRQCRQPAGPLPDHRPGDLGRRPAAGSTPSPAPSARGGTLAGVGMFLKERNPDVRIVCADPMGAALYNFYKHGELKAEGSSITEGIGQGRITANLEGAPIDDARADHRRRGPADRLRSGGRRGAGARRLLRHQHRRRHSRGPRPGPGPHGRDRAVPTTAPAIRASCSTRHSCARRACRLPSWLA